MPSSLRRQPAHPTLTLQASDDYVESPGPNRDPSQSSDVARDRVSVLRSGREAGQDQERLLREVAKAAYWRLERGGRPRLLSPASIWIIVVV